MQNLFVLVLLASLSQENTKSASDIFENTFESFKEHYLKFLKDSKQRELKTKDVLKFFTTLQAPMGKTSNFFIFMLLNLQAFQKVIMASLQIIWK